MAKVAAIAPVLAGISAPAALGIGAALTGGSALLSRYGQNQHIKRQNEANDRWLAYQRDKTNRFEAKDRENRLKAEAALAENLDNSDGASRAATIAAEEERLADEFTKNIPTTADEIRGSGQETGISQVFDEELARSVGNATKEAKDRMKALATATAYGSGSMGSMGMTDMLRNIGTSNTLSGINNNRRGDIGILQRYQTVEPEFLEYKESPLVPIMNAAGSFFLGGGPQNLASMLGGGGAASSTVSASTPSTATGAGSALTSSLRPVARPWGSPLAPIGYNGMTTGFA